MTEPDRERLAKAISDRRKALGLSLSAAARIASIDRGTWTATERGTRQTEEYTYAGIERTLRWASGSVERILAGGEPTEAPVQTVDVVRPHIPIDLDYRLDQIRALDIPAATKLRLVETLVALAAEAQAEAEQAEAEQASPHPTR